MEANNAQIQVLALSFRDCDKHRVSTIRGVDMKNINLDIWVEGMIGSPNLTH